MTAFPVFFPMALPKLSLLQEQANASQLVFKFTNHQIAVSVLLQVLVELHQIQDESDVTLLSIDT